jgi:hypothetical protein
LLAVLSTVVVYTLFWLDVRDPRMLEAIPMLRALGAIAAVVALLAAAAYAWHRLMPPGRTSLLTTIVMVIAWGVARKRVPIAEFVMGEFADGVGAANDLVLLPIVVFAAVALVASGYFRPLTDEQLDAETAALEAANPMIDVNDGLPIGTRVLIYDPDCAGCATLMERVRAAERAPSLLFASMHSEFARGVYARHPKLARVASPIVVERDDLFGELASTGWNVRVALEMYAQGKPSRVSRELSVALPRVMLDAGVRIFGGHAHAPVDGMAASEVRARVTGRGLG